MHLIYIPAEIVFLLVDLAEKVQFVFNSTAFISSLFVDNLIVLKIIMHKTFIILFCDIFILSFRFSFTKSQLS